MQVHPDNTTIKGDPQTVSPNKKNKEIINIKNNHIVPMDTSLEQIDSNMYRSPSPIHLSNNQINQINLSYQKQKGDDTEVEEYSILSSIMFFVKHSYRDVWRRKVHFLLSFLSVFIVVWSALVIQTLVQKGPIIFLKLAEGDVG